MTNTTTFWKNGQIVSAQEATVSVLDHGLLYGDGVFEGVRYYNLHPFSLGKHIERLRASLTAIGIDLAYSDESLIAGVQTCITASGQEDGYLRILVTRGEGLMGVSPVSCNNPNIFIIASTIQLVSEASRKKGLSLITSSLRRVTGAGVDPRIKSLNYLPAVMAKAEALRLGADEALILNQQGQVAECSVENIFIVKSGVLYTPPVADGLLAGITRETIIGAAHSLSIAVREESFFPYDLHNADECFITGTGAGLLPIRELDGKCLKHCPGVIFNQLYEKYLTIVGAHCQVESV